MQAFLAHTRHQADRQQGMPAQFEEMVVAPYPLHLQHLGPEPRQGGFKRPLGRLEIAAQHRFQARLRQCIARQLAVGAQGQRRQLHIGCRHHVLRQTLQDMGPQRLDPRRRHPGVQAEIGHQALATHQHRHLAQGRVAGQPRLDFPQLQAQPPQLDLEVVAPEELQVAVSVVAHPVTAAVQPVAGDEGAVDKALGLQLRQAQVTPGNPDPANVQLAADALGHRLVMGIQHIQPSVGDGLADGQLYLRHRCPWLQGPGAAVHGGSVGP